MKRVAGHRHTRKQQGQPDYHAEGSSTLAHNNAELVRDLYDAFRTGDMPTVERLLADDVIWHAPGRGRNAGIRRGKAELYAAMGQLAELTGGSLGAEIHDVLANDHHAVIIQTTRGNRPGFAPL